MPHLLPRRDFLTQSALWTAGALAAPRLAANLARAEDKPLFEISLAEWSLHRTIFGGKLDNLDFPKAAKEQFGIHAVEFVTPLTSIS
jgi:hypothetical protein